MHWLTQAFLGLFLAGVVRANLFSLCETSTTITSQDDAEQYDSCKEFSGDIMISSQASGAIQLSGIEHITGSLTCNGALNVTSISCPDLKSIGSNFELSTMAMLSALGVGSLTKVGRIHWDAIYNLQEVEFGDGLTVEDNVRIEDTRLESLDGLALEKVGDLRIINNTYLSSFDLSRLANYTSINIAGNSPKLEVDLSGAATGGTTEIHNVSGLSLKQMETITGDLTLVGGTFSNITAPKLTRADTMMIKTNSLLEAIHMPQLRSASGLTILHNGNLTSIGARKLESVKGDFEVEGPLTHINVPELENIEGSFTINSTKKVNCHDVSNLHVKGPLYYCSSSGSNFTFPLNQNGPSTSSSNQLSDDDNGATSHGGLDNEGKIGLGVGLGVGIPVLITFATVVICLKRRRSQPKTTLPAEVPDTEWHVHQLPGSRRDITAELDNGIVPELDGAKTEPSELPGSSLNAAELEAPGQDCH